MPRRRPDWNPDTSKRDPRIDPKPGDVLGIGRSRTYVWDVADSIIIYARRPKPDGLSYPNTRYCVPIGIWRMSNRRPDVFVYNVAEASP